MVEIRSVADGFGHGPWTTTPRRMDVSVDVGWRVFNPSTVSGADYVTFRTSNYVLRDDGVAYSIDVASGHAEVRNRLLVQQTSSGSIVEIPGLPGARRGPEDARLFWRDGELYVSATMLEPALGAMPPLMAERPLLSSTARWTPLLHDGRRRTEKNWMPYSDGALVDGQVAAYLYSAGVVARVDRMDGRVSLVEIGRGPVPPGARGGTPIVPLDDDHAIGVVHYTQKLSMREYDLHYHGAERRHATTNFSTPSQPRRYHSQVVLFSRTSGLPVRVGPIFSLHNWRSTGVEFVSGISVSMEHGVPTVSLLYGRGDAEAWRVDGLDPTALLGAM